MRLKRILKCNGDSGLEERTDRERSRKPVVMALVAAVLLVLVVTGFYSCRGIDQGTLKPTYEDGVPGYEPDVDITASSTRLNLPVLPDYIITKEKPDIMIPYPEQNIYDIEFSFLKKGSDKVLYRTNRIVPGMTVLIPAYDFIKESGDYEVRVSAFDHETYEEVVSLISLEANIIKK